jgi:hypothetical protein
LFDASSEVLGGHRGVSVVAAGPAAAAKGGNNDTAKACQHGGWKTQVPAAGGTYANQGDCVNDGAQASSAFSDVHGSQTCGDIGGTFRSKGPTWWACLYGGNPADTAELQTACGDDGGPSFVVVPPSNDPFGGQTAAICHQA